MKISAEFAPTQTAEMARRVQAGTTTSIVGIPGAGIALFLKHLSKNLPGFKIYVELSTLPALTTQAFYAELLEKLGGESQNKTAEELVLACKEHLESAAKHNEKIVIFIAGFDRLGPEFSVGFFHYLRSLRAVDPTKIVFVFGLCSRIETLLPANLINTDLSLFSSVYYLRPYSNDDLRSLLLTYGPHMDVNPAEVNRLLELSGGHFQFLQLLLGSEKRGNPAEDPFIQLAFKNVFTHLSTKQKAIVRKLATDGTYPKADDYLTNLGIVKKQGEVYELFSPLFTSCVRTFSAPKLPLKERRLLAILKRNEGRVVSKRDIFDEVWRGQEIGSEWALNALLYRLRKHPAFIAQNFTIENHKKSGYSLVKDFGSY